MKAINENYQTLSQREIFKKIMDTSRIYNETAGLNVEKAQLEKQRDMVHSLLEKSRTPDTIMFYKLEEEALQHRIYLCESRITLSKLFIDRCATITKLFASSLVDPIVREDLFLLLYQETLIDNQYSLNMERATIHIHNRCKEYLDVLCKEGFSTSKQAEVVNSYPRSNDMPTHEEQQLRVLATNIKEKFISGNQPAEILADEFKQQALSLRLDEKQKRECDIFIAMLTGSTKSNEKDDKQNDNETKQFIHLPIRLLNREERNLHVNRIESYKQLAEEYKTIFAGIDSTILDSEMISLDTLLKPNAFKVIETLYLQNFHKAIPNSPSQMAAGMGK